MVRDAFHPFATRGCPYQPCFFVFFHVILTSTISAPAVKISNVSLVKGLRVAKSEAQSGEEHVCPTGSSPASSVQRRGLCEACR